MSKTSNVLLGVLGAAAAGVVVGLLIAPDKGSETRKKISQKTGDLRDKMSSLLQSGKDYLHDVAATMSEEAEGLQNDAQTRYNQVKSDIS